MGAGGHAVFPVAVDRQPPGSPEARAAAMAGGLAALRAGKLPVCEARVATAAEIDAWLATAKPGERFVYCTGPTIVRGLTSEHAARLYRQGKVELHQKARTDCAGCDFMVIRKGGAAAATTRRSSPFDGFDEATRTILARIEECAARTPARRCFTNNELARMAGLATAQQAAWRVVELVKARIIASDTVAAGPNAGWRTVTICASGKSTAAPPARAEAR